MSKLTLKTLLIPKIFNIIFNNFLATDYPQLMKVCKKFQKLLKDNLSEQIRYVVSALDQNYSKCFITQKPCIKYLRKKQNDHSNRVIDIIVEAELKILGTLDSNKSYTISYSYQYFDYGKRTTKILCWETQFNLVKSGREIWIYKEETRNHFAKDNISLIQDILPVKVGDSLILRIPYLTRFGFTNMKSLRFYSLKKQSFIKRECQIQKHFSWTLYKYFDHPIQFQIQDIIRMYPGHLQVVQIRCAGVDYVNFKIKLRAKRQGKLGQLLDHPLTIKNSKASIKALLKKKGCYQQGHALLQLRVGDQIIIYHTPNF